MILEIEPTPRNQWGLSLAHLLPRGEWMALRDKTFRGARYVCQLCGEDDRQDLTCHEVWVFDDIKLTQTLQTLESTCSMCHNIHHFGRSRLTYKADYIKALIAHWCDVNGLTLDDFTAYEKEIAQINFRRATKIYTVIAYGKELGTSDYLVKDLRRHKIGNK